MRCISDMVQGQGGYWDGFGRVELDRKVHLNLRFLSF